MLQFPQQYSEELLIILSDYSTFVSGTNYKLTRDGTFLNYHLVLPLFKIVHTKSNKKRHSLYSRVDKQKKSVHVA